MDDRMRKKLQALIIMNLLLLTIILFFNGYRLTRSSFYKKDLKLYDSVNFKEIYKDKKMTVVAYDNFYKIYYYENIYPLPRLVKMSLDDYFLEPYFEWSGITDTFIYFKENQETSITHLYDHDYLVYTSLDKIFIKWYNTKTQQSYDLKYDIVQIDDNLFHYKYLDTRIKSDEDVTLFYDIQDQKIFTAQNNIYYDLYNIQFNGQTFNQILVNNPFDEINYVPSTQHGAQFKDRNIHLIYEKKYIDSFSWEIYFDRYQYFESDHKFYLQIDEQDHTSSIYRIDNDEFEHALKLFKELLD